MSNLFNFVHSLKNNNYLVSIINLCINFNKNYTKLNDTKIEVNFLLKIIQIFISFSTFGIF